ncbi:zinc finger and BTB domain-containing protein 5 [Grus japonensis]|uniref:Zinc finger and BTB domain-containing protein 5 n=1 Tax=Grus japonensis TaxID=30415 RepID=A0ABC9VS16_GRUJA
MEDPMPEQVEAPEGGRDPVGSPRWSKSGPDQWTREEGSPRQVRFAGRTCDPVGDPRWSSLLLKVCTPWKGPTLEQLVKNCSPWEGLTLEKLVEDCFL